MPNTERYARPPSAESRGEAPGRGRLTGRRLLVVGGGQRTFDAATDPIGNGRAMSLLFAREGARVAVADMNRAGAEETVCRIRQEGGGALAIEADIGREADVARMIGEAVEGLGGLDGMVLNVGIGVGGRGLAGVEVAEWDQTLAVNLRGPMLCCREALPAARRRSLDRLHLLDRGPGRGLAAGVVRCLEGRARGTDASRGARGLPPRNPRETSSVPVWSTRRSAASPAPDGRPARARPSPSDGSHGLGDRLCRAVLHLGRERLRDRADARGG